MSVIKMLIAHFFSLRNYFEDNVYMRVCHVEKAVEEKSDGASLFLE